MIGRVPRIGGIGVIVIVEDEELLAELAVDIVSDLGCGAVSFRSAEDAIAYLSSHSEEVDGVFTDIRLAGPMSGLQLARHVSSHWPWMHLLIVSGVAQPAPDALPRNAVFIQKPWQATQLEAFIR
jgi:DNA-binding NtrC family response regulator